MDAITLLKADHQAVEKKFKEFEGLGPRAAKSKAAIVAFVTKALSVHATVEEALVYPAIRAKITPAESDVLEALEEHHLVKLTLAELAKMSPKDERYDAKFTVLMENVRHHVKEEEKGLFPQVRKSFTRTELADLGEQIERAKKTAPTRPHPGAPDAPPLNAVAAAVTAPFDLVRSAGEAAVRTVRSVIAD